MALEHNIPVGALVEVKESEDSLREDTVMSNAGVRLFVLRHNRDCDGTPLYALGLASDYYFWKERGLDENWCPRMYGGYPEESLTVIRLPQDDFA
jgi:hypothetical protein